MKNSQKFSENRDFSEKKCILPWRYQSAKFKDTRGIHSLYPNTQRKIGPKRMQGFLQLWTKWTHQCISICKEREVLQHFMWRTWNSTPARTTCANRSTGFLSGSGWRRLLLPKYRAARNMVTSRYRGHVVRIISMLEFSSGKAIFFQQPEIPPVRTSDPTVQ